MTSKNTTDEAALPQGRKDWTKPPQATDGPEGPEPHPTPDEAGAGERGTVKKPQHVKGPEGPDPTPDGWPPRNHRHNTDPKPQQIDGPEGPAPTDGTELIEAATGQKARAAAKAAADKPKESK